MGSTYTQCLFVVAAANVHTKGKFIVCAQNTTECGWGKYIYSACLPVSVWRLLAVRRRRITKMTTVHMVPVFQRARGRGRESRRASERGYQLTRARGHTEVRRGTEWQTIKRGVYLRVALIHTFSFLRIIYALWQICQMEFRLKIGWKIQKKTKHMLCTFLKWIFSSLHLKYPGKHMRAGQKDIERLTNIAMLCSEMFTQVMCIFPLTARRRRWWHGTQIFKPLITYIYTWYMNIIFRGILCVCVHCESMYRARHHSQ